MGMNLDFGGNNELAWGRGDLRGGAHLLEALIGRDPRLAQSFPGLARDMHLRALADSYASFAGLSGTSLAALMRRGNIGPSSFVPRPNMASCACPNRYAAAPNQDIQGNGPLESFLRNNPFERQQLEMAIGGRIVSSGDGRLGVQPFTTGAFPSGGTENNAAFAAQAMLGMMQRAAGEQMMQSAFQGMVLNAMSRMLQNGGNPQSGQGPQGQTLQSIRDQGRNPFVDWSEDAPNQARRRNMGGAGGPAAAIAAAMQAMTGMPGAGDAQGDFMSAAGPQGDFMNAATPQAAGMYNPDPYGGDTNAVLSDSGLTVEDKITLMIMMIMKQMDKQIEAQANYINSLQQQQNAGGGKGGGGKGGGGGAPSIDVETMKLKRLIDKRSQMFDMLRQIIDKYNQTAKGIIDSMGR